LKKILIIDDEESIVDIASYLLKEKGFIVETTLNKNILSTFETFLPDLALIDIRIKGEADGKDLCKTLKEKHIFIALLFSAYPNLEKIYRTCDADGFIEKPFDINELVNIVEGYLLN